MRRTEDSKKNLPFHLILGIFKNHVMMTYILRSFMALVYRGYHKIDLHAITSRLRGHLPILGNKNQNVNKGGKGVKLG